MKLFFIYRKDTNKKTLRSFHLAASELGVDIIEVISDNFDFSEYEVIGADDAVYCASDDHRSLLVEKCLIGSQTKTFYKNFTTAILKQDDIDDITSHLIFKAHNLRFIDSIFAITEDKQLLRKYAEKLGGPPLIIKSLGGQKGHGLIKIDSYESLNSIDDFLVGLNGRFILKRFIKESRSIRIVVIGNQAVAAIEHHALEGDFRSNSGKGDHHTTAYQPSQEEALLAIQAVNVLGLEFGGVDISVDSGGVPYITEVNMPCAFVRTEEHTGVPIAKKMVEHLIYKSNFTEN